MPAKTDTPPLARTEDVRFRLVDAGSRVGLLPTLELGFPGRHLIGVDVEMLGQLGQGPIALDRRQAPPSP